MLLLEPLFVIVLVVIAVVGVALAAPIWSVPAAGMIRIGRRAVKNGISNISSAFTDTSSKENPDE